MKRPLFLKGVWGKPRALPSGCDILGWRPPFWEFQRPQVLHLLSFLFNNLKTAVRIRFEDFPLALASFSC